MREVNFYKSSFGKSPINDFLDSLSGKQAQKITWVLEIIEESRQILGVIEEMPVEDLESGIVN
ncbi:MAG: hypothetical protein IH795_05180, partial [Bacteroidetes bacterium]|nr:hypothetical protein [Bacteroidota bacterium]